MQLLMVRHGEAKSNVDVVNGVVGSDKPLTAEGIKQTKATAQFLGTMALAEEIYSSPYRRTLQTSEILAERLKLNIVVDDRLKEISKGDWHGRPVQEVIELEGEVPEAQKHLYRPPGGENWLDVGARVVGLIQELVQEPKDQCLLVSHNHPIQMAIGALLDRPISQWEDISVATASVTGLRLENDRWQLEDGRVSYAPYEH